MSKVSPNEKNTIKERYSKRYRSLEIEEPHPFVERLHKEFGIWCGPCRFNRMSACTKEWTRGCITQKEQHNKRQATMSVWSGTHTHDDVSWSDWRLMCVWGVMKDKARNIGFRYCARPSWPNQKLGLGLPAMRKTCRLSSRERLYWIENQFNWNWCDQVVLTTNKVLRAVLLKLEHA